MLEHSILHSVPKFPIVFQNFIIQIVQFFITIVSKVFLPCDPYSSDKSFKSSIHNSSKLSKSKILSHCVEIVNHNSDGNCSELHSFIDSVELLESIIEDSDKETLRKFIMSRLTGKTRLAIYSNNKTIDDIKKSLLETIKPIGYKLIEAQMQTLAQNKLNVLNFINKGIELANSLDESLVYERLPIEFKKSMVIKHTVDMCQSYTCSDKVKFILEARSPGNVEDIFTKFLISSAKVNKVDSQNLENSYKIYDFRAKSSVHLNYPRNLSKDLNTISIKTRPISFMNDSNISEFSTNSRKNTYKFDKIEKILISKITVPLIIAIALATIIIFNVVIMYRMNRMNKYEF